MNRIRAEAENILQYEHDLTDMPGGLPSIASIDAGRIKVQVNIVSENNKTSIERLRLHDLVGVLFDEHALSDKLAL